MISLLFRTLTRFFSPKQSSIVNPHKHSETPDQEAEGHATVLEGDDLMQLVDCLDQVCH